MNLFFANSNREESTNMTEDTEQSAEMTTRKDEKWMASNNVSSD